MTDIENVRLLIADTASTIFTDTQISAFLDLEDDDVYLGASVALLAMSADAALVAKLVTSLNVTVDRKSIPAALRALAKEYKAKSQDSPAFAIAEVGYTKFSVQDIIENRAIRDS